LVPASSCASCHDLASKSDPIAQCLDGPASTTGDRFALCFDEHQAALAPLFDKRAGGLPPGGVCASQHTLDRPVAWEAAREVVSKGAILTSGGSRGGALAWLATGLGAAMLALFGVRLRDARIERKKQRIENARDELIRPATRVRLPQINVNTCLGCYACVDACPYDVLEIDRYVARVVRPEACCGLTLCEQRCPNGSLVITDGEAIGDRPRLRDTLESEDASGLYLAGDVTGLPLIKNAIRQGALAADRIAASLSGAPKESDALDLLIVGAGPAGISAALRAKELELRFEVIEQGSVAQSIQSFPRGKLVFDQPLELPLTGKLWLKESTKEELLGQWLRLIRKERLPIEQDTRVTSIARDGAGSFRVTSEPREGGAPRERRARRVLLAIGQRGTPRRLPFELDPAVEPRVHYHLADARSFEGKRVIVVGLGDVAMEAALALAGQPRTEVTILHRGPAFSRGNARNIDAVQRAVARGRVTLRFEAHIVSMDAERASIGGREPTSIAYDAVFVLIGSIPPSEMLRAAGVRTASEGGARDRTEGPAVQEPRLP
jgi:thioredoxin reductase/NAD-dependent dihydropyrimidine dehydrogenase PreA subunit